MNNNNSIGVVAPAEEEDVQECPICLEALFDEQGVARNGDVAKIVCCHLVHSDCLERAGQSLNSDGRRYGIGGFGLRSGCPVCNHPVSYWNLIKMLQLSRIFGSNEFSMCWSRQGWLS